MLNTADTIAVVSPDLLDRYAGDGRVATLVPNGCDPLAYADVDTAVVPGDAQLPGPVAGFVGHINARIDLELLTAVADTGCSLLIVGPLGPGYRSRQFLALADRPNVRWVGGKQFHELPGYLGVIDVGLVPYADTTFNRASFPLKTLEYLAAGRGVVSTPLPATNWLATELIKTASGPTGFATAVVKALAEPRTDEIAEHRRAFAAEHSWARRANVIAGLVGLDPV